MIVTLDKALSILGERTFENHQMLRQARRQRRTEYTDIYGVPFESEIDNKKVSEFHLFISPDLEYWERFQFKIRVTGANVDEDVGFDPDDFTIKFAYIDEETQDPDDPEKWTKDLAEYFEAQHGAWVDNNGYFPSEDISDEEADVEDFYDVLDACTVMWEEGDTTNANRILKAGSKKIQIAAPVDCKITFIPYIKYSTVNR